MQYELLKAVPVKFQLTDGKANEKAVLAGSDRDVGHIFKDQLDKRMAIEERKTIPTPWEEVNKILDGGVGPGELCVICAVHGTLHCLLSVHAINLMCLMF